MLTRLYRIWQPFRGGGLERQEEPARNADIYGFAYMCRKVSGCDCVWGTEADGGPETLLLGMALYLTACAASYS